MFGPVEPTTIACHISRALIAVVAKSAYVWPSISGSGVAPNRRERIMTDEPRGKRGSSRARVTAGGKKSCMRSSASPALRSKSSQGAMRARVAVPRWLSVPVEIYLSQGCDREVHVVPDEFLERLVFDHPGRVVDLRVHHRERPRIDAAERLPNAFQQFRFKLLVVLILVRDPYKDIAETTEEGLDRTRRAVGDPDEQRQETRCPIVAEVLREKRKQPTVTRLLAQPIAIRRSLSGTADLGAVLKDGGIFFNQRLRVPSASRDGRHPPPPATT